MHAHKKEKSRAFCSQTLGAPGRALVTSTQIFTAMFRHRDNEPPAGPPRSMLQSHRAPVGAHALFGGCWTEAHGSAGPVWGPLAPSQWRTRVPLLGDLRVQKREVRRHWATARHRRGDLVVGSALALLPKSLFGFILFAYAGIPTHPLDAADQGSTGKVQSGH